MSTDTSTDKSDGSTDPGALWVQSIRTVPGSDLPSAALLSWYGEDWPAPVEDIRQTAIDMVTCAGYAECMVELTSIGLPVDHVSQLFTGLIGKTGRKGFGCPSTVELLPAGGKDRRKGGERVPVVLLRRGKREGFVGSDTARSMAQQWFEVAEAVDSDAHLVQALRTAGAPDGFESLLFAELFRLRTAGTGGPLG